MSSTAAAAVGDVLPSLPPIRTTATAESSPPVAAEDARSATAESSSTAPDAESRPSPAAAGKWQEEEAGSQQQEAEPTTPTSEESRLRPPTECPPAPRKPKWAAPPSLAKRKFPSTTSAPTPPPRAFFPVARDLSAVFRSLPPKKRIRAG